LDVVKVQALIDGISSVTAQPLDVILSQRKGLGDLFFIPKSGSDAPLTGHLSFILYHWSSENSGGAIGS
jgi:hypothetical protein